jgi:hypothetical protein
MPTPPTPEAKLRRTVELYNETAAAGHDPDRLGFVQELVRRGKAEGLFTNRTQHNEYLRAAKDRLGLEPDPGAYRQARYQQPSPKLQLLPAPAPRLLESNEPLRRILVIPDRHNDPRHPHRIAATTWIARLGSELRPSEVIDLGDSITMDSCSRHDKNDTLKGRYKPSIRDDLDNHVAMLQAFERGRDPDWRPRLKRVRGNHEQRLSDFENQHPENEGTHTHRYMQDLLQFGWQERPFGEIYYSSGVGFSHAPMLRGKPQGGKTGPLRASNDLCRSLVHGHSHTFHWYDAPKNDPCDKISVISAGCALPEGEIEHYATHGGATGWRYGVLDLWVRAGDIVDFAFISMASLRSRFSDDGADVRGAA